MTAETAGQMLIIAGHYRMDAARRDAYVAAFDDLQRRARRAPECLDVVDCPDREAAVALVQAHPMARAGRIELRELWDGGG